MFTTILKVLSKVVSIATLVKPVVNGFKLTWENKNTDTVSKVIQTITIGYPLYKGITNEIKK